MCDDQRRPAKDDRDRDDNDEPHERVALHKSTSKEDLLASGIDNLRESLKERQRQGRLAGGSDEGLFALSGELFTHANEHRTVFRAMVGKRSGAVVQQLLQKMLVDLVRDEVKATWAGIENDTPVEAVSQFIGGGLFGLLLWSGNGRMHRDQLCKTS